MDNTSTLILIWIGLFFSELIVVYFFNKKIKFLSEGNLERAARNGFLATTLHSGQYLLLAAMGLFIGGDPIISLIIWFIGLLFIGCGNYFGTRYKNEIESIVSRKKEGK